METGIAVGGGSRPRRRWTVSEKRRIVEDTLSSTRSLASLARQHGVNANQLFSWRKQYHAGQLSEDQFAEPARSVQLLPVSVADDEPLAVEQEQIKTLPPPLTINIDIPHLALFTFQAPITA